MRQYLAVVNRLPGGTEPGNAFAFLMALRQHMAPAPYFRLSDELAYLLAHTDIAEDIPVACLRPPYPRMYIEFGTGRDLGLMLPNTETGWHVLEGAYVEHGAHPEVGTGLYVMLTGSPLGKAHALDDAVAAVLLPMADETQPLTEALRWSFERSLEMVRATGLRESPTEFLDASFACSTWPRRCSTSGWPRRGAPRIRSAASFLGNTRN